MMNYINMRISADSLNIEEINKEFDFINPIYHKKGDKGEYKGEKFVFNEDIWQIKTEVVDNDLVETFEQLIIKLYDKKTFLQELSSKSDFSLWITIYPDNVQINFRLKNDILKKLTEIGANLDLSVMNLTQLYDI